MDRQNLNASARQQYSPLPGTAEARGGRRRVKTWACSSCQTRKIKCDGNKPSCGTCLAHQRQCRYDPRALQSRSRPRGLRFLQADSFPDGVEASDPRTDEQTGRTPRSDTNMRFVSVHQDTQHPSSTMRHHPTIPDRSLLWISSHLMGLRRCTGMAQGHPIIQGVQTPQRMRWPKMSPVLKTTWR